MHHLVALVRGLCRGSALRAASQAAHDGVIVMREFDIYGDQPELASLINEVQHEVRNCSIGRLGIHKLMLFPAENPQARPVAADRWGASSSLCSLTCVGFSVVVRRLGNDLICVHGNYQYMTDNDEESKIRWPDEFRPERSPVFVSNRLTMSVAPERAWA